MQHHEPECHAEKVVCYLQGQGHSEGSYNQNMTLYYIFLFADPFTNGLSLMVTHHKPECLVKKSGFTVFKVKATAKVQHVNGCLYDIYLLNLLLANLVC